MEYSYNILYIPCSFKVGCVWVFLKIYDFYSKLLIEKNAKSEKQ